MLNTKKILVIGDVMLDVYFGGEVTRISPEAPVPVFRKKSERYVLGGASNVAANLAAANQKVAVLALVGRDPDGEKIKGMLNAVGIDSSLVSYWDRPTITKTRFLAENNQQVLRLDIEDSHAVSPEEAEALAGRFRQVADRFDIVLLSDYLKGLLTYELTQSVISVAKAHNIRVLVDVKDPDYRKYKGAWLLKPNLNELRSLTKMPVSSEEELVAAAEFLRKGAECEYVLTTCGSKGMVLVGKETVYHLDTVGKSVYDVTGAGDTTIAYLTAALASGIEIKQAMKIANQAAGIQVGKVGTSAVYLHEVEEAMSSDKQNRKQKVFRMNERELLLQRIAEWRSRGETVVTTNGCFDIIHRGHISLLEKAGTFGDHLVVLINSDQSVKRLKGPSRPVNSEEDRAMVIAALDCVDAVALFDPLRDNKAIPENELAGLDADLKRIATEAPMGILRMIAPDIHAKGGDYSEEQVPEAMYAKGFRAVPFVEGYSTTKTIEKANTPR